MKNLLFYITFIGVFTSCTNETSITDKTEESTTESVTSLEDHQKTLINTSELNEVANDSEPKITDIENESSTLESDDNPFSSFNPSDIRQGGDGRDGDVNSQALGSGNLSDYDFHAYKGLTNFLKKYVSSSGKVNYKAIAKDKISLAQISKEFEAQKPDNSWSKNKKLAYWINAYNIFTIQLIIDNFPTTSITKITAKPWHIKFINLKGTKYSLDQIENDIIRKQFNEPRIHFALNCASESCPSLLNTAYKASTLNSQLSSQTKKFLNDTSKNTYGEKEIKISPIFQWYAEDFKKNGSSVISFINKYRSDQLTDQKIKYSDYSWELND